jgi:hypothetical protein
MGQAVLHTTARHILAPAAAAFEATVEDGGEEQPAAAARTRQPAPPQTLRPSAALLGQRNEDGSHTAFNALTPQQRFEFDVRGYFVLRGHYSAAQVAAFHAGVDEVQALPMTHTNFEEVGPLWAVPDRTALADPCHPHWTGRTVAQDASERKQTSMSMLIAGSKAFDPIVRDPVMKAIHRELAGGECMLSGNYYIEKHGPCAGGSLHHGGFPRMRSACDDDSPLL